jgi:hypothetical protein
MGEDERGSMFIGGESRRREDNKAGLVCCEDKNTDLVFVEEVVAVSSLLNECGMMLCVSGAGSLASLVSEMDGESGEDLVGSWPHMSVLYLCLCFMCLWVVAQLCVSSGCEYAILPSCLAPKNRLRYVPVGTLDEFSSKKALYDEVNSCYSTIFVVVRKVVDILWRRTN